MNAAGPGLNDPLLYQQSTHVGGGASPVLIIAIAIALACVLYLICSGWLTPPGRAR